MRLWWLLTLAGCFDFEGLEKLYHPGDDLSVADLSDFSGADLSSADFSGVDFSGVDISVVNADLMSLADLRVSPDLTGADLQSVPPAFTAQLPCLTLGTSLGLLSLAAWDGNHANGPDLLVGANGSKQVFPLFANSSGTGFGGGTIVTLPSNVTGVAGGDFDGDGTPDVIATTGGNLYWLRGTSVGVYASPSPIHNGTQINAVVAGSFDGDNKLDAAFVDGSASQAVIGTMGAAGGFGKYQTASTSAAGGQAIVTADLDNDGDLDLVVADHAGSAVDTFINSGGTFALQTSIPLGLLPGHLAAGDVNGDGFADIAVISDNQMMVVLFNDTGGMFEVTQSTSLSPEGPAGLVIADFNGDGYGDIAYAGSVTNTLYILSGLGNGTFVASMTYPTCVGATTVLSADFNLDNRPDLVIGCLGTASQVCEFLNTTP